jgi:hypothetical protein
MKYFSRLRMSEKRMLREVFEIKERGGTRRTGNVRK